MNELPEAQFNDIDDLLAFVSIYDDENRTHAYFEMLDKNIELIQDKVCVEAGCGFGLMAERMAMLGAKKVYAVEANRHLYEIAKNRLVSFDNIEVVFSDIRQFLPDEKIDLLVHEFFGQLLFDEDIHVLDELLFSPHVTMPNKATLNMSLFPKNDVIDDVVTDDVLKRLDGALISGLFEDEAIKLNDVIMQWQPGRQELKTTVDLSQHDGDVLCFGLEIFHDDQFICRAGECDNWSLVWTPRAGERFELKFQPTDRGTAVFFDWL